MNSDFKPTSDVRSQTKLKLIPTQELERIGQALKDPEFCKLFAEYAEELSNPENRKLYEEELTKLEQEQGNDITFFNHEPGFVVKTKELNNDLKTFVNICHCDKVEPPSSQAMTKPDGTKGTSWSIPHSLSAHREDLDKAGKPCIVYDAVFHPRALALAGADVRLRDMLVNTALEGVHSRFPEHKLDQSALKFPKMKYKGIQQRTILRGAKPDGGSQTSSNDALKAKLEEAQRAAQAAKRQQEKETLARLPNEPAHRIVYRQNFDIADYQTNCQTSSGTHPAAIVVTIELPECPSAKTVSLDISEKSLRLTTPAPTNYALDLELTYTIKEAESSAKFDKSRRELTVTMPTVLPVQPKRLIEEIVPTISDVTADADDNANTTDSAEVESEATEVDQTDDTSSAERSTVETETVPEPGESQNRRTEARELPNLTLAQDKETVSVIIDTGRLASEVTMDFTETQFGPLKTHTCVLTYEISQQEWVEVHNIYVKFDAALVPEKCKASAGDENIVLLLTKAEAGIWHRLQAGITSGSLKEFKFETEELLQANIDALPDPWESSASESCTIQKTVTEDEAVFTFVDRQEAMDNSASATQAQPASEPVLDSTPVMAADSPPQPPIDPPSEQSKPPTEVLLTNNLMFDLDD